MGFYNKVQQINILLDLLRLVYLTVVKRAECKIRHIDYTYKLDIYTRLYPRLNL